MTPNGIFRYGFALSLLIGFGLVDLPSASAAPNEPKSEQTGAQDNTQITPTAKQHSVLKVIAGESLDSVIPRVWLSGGHAKFCKVGVGESFPDIKLPQLGGEATDLAAFRGKQATVVIFWHPDRWMARTALIDMQRDIVQHVDPEQVSVVGIAVDQPTGSVQRLIDEAKASFPQLLDTEGEALAKVGVYALPRIYVLDPEGTIVWFDIEYSEGTRRELWQAVSALTLAE